MRDSAETTVGTRIAHVARGSAIGVAEAVPGVSGGTIALVTGVYEKLINSAGFLLSAVRAAVTDVPRGRGRGRAGEAFRAVHWNVVLPVLLGMVPGLLIAARLLEPLLERYPVQTRGLFLGLVAASIVVPVLMIGDRWRAREVAAMVVAGVAAYVLTGLPATTVTPNPVVVFLAASVAVCALVLPGVSGSFLLLTFRLYEPTIAAVNDRDLGYLAVFAARALFGLAGFVKVLQWLLAHRRRITLAVMTGVIAGSLRALWPWQTEERGLLAPDHAVLPTVLLVLAGLALVLGLVLVERWSLRRSARGAAINPADPAGTDDAGPGGSVTGGHRAH